MIKRNICLLTILLLFQTTMFAQFTVNKYYGLAVVDSVYDPDTIITGIVDPSDLFSGIIKYDENSLDVDPNPERGLYKYPAPPNSFDLTFYNDTHEEDTLDFYMEVINSPGFDKLTFFVDTGYAFPAPYDSLKKDSAFFYFVDSTGTAFSSDAIPTAISMDMFDTVYAAGYFSHLAGTMEFKIFGHAIDMDTTPVMLTNPTSPFKCSGYSDSIKVAYYKYSILDLNVDVSTLDSAVLPPDSISYSLNEIDSTISIMARPTAEHTPVNMKLTSWYFNSDTVETTIELVQMNPQIDTVIIDSLAPTGACLDIQNTMGDTAQQYFLDSVLYASSYICSVAPDTIEVWISHSTCTSDSVQIIVPSFSLDSIYPGDANADGIVNPEDIFPIGYLYGQTGPVRPSASTLWQGSLSFDWNDTTTFAGNDFKHADCNGDGIIDELDAPIIDQNYGNMHSKTHEFSSSGPPLFIVALKDSINENEEAEFGIKLGDINSGVLDVSAVGIVLNIEEDVINGAEVKFNQSWIGFEGVNMVTFSHVDTAAGIIAFGMSKYNGAPSTGFGTIAKITVDVEVPATQYVGMHIGDVSIINNGINDTVQVSTDPAWNETIKVFNIPAGIASQELNINCRYSKQQIRWHFTGIQNTWQVEILDGFGRFIKQTTITPGNTDISAEGLPNGMYMLHIYNDKHSTTVKTLKW